MRTRHLNRLLIVAMLLIPTAPLFAQRAQPDATKLKADAQKVVSTINGDKAKTSAYCEIEGLAPQIERATQEKDHTKAEALGQRVDELEKQLGPEYLALFDALDEENPNSDEVREILSMFDRLDQSCPH